MRSHFLTITLFAFIAVSSLDSRAEVPNGGKKAPLPPGVVNGPDSPPPVGKKSPRPELNSAGPIGMPPVGKLPTVISPKEAASRFAERVTVDFQVKSYGSNPDGYIELYSEPTWQAEGCFFVRFSEESRNKFSKAKIADVGRFFNGSNVRVTGEVKLLKFNGSSSTHPVIYVEELSQIQLVGASSHATPKTPTALIIDDGEFFGPSAIAKANQIIQETQRRWNKQLIVETFKEIPSDRSERFKEITITDKAALSKFYVDWANSRFSELHVNGVYILICRSPSYVQTIVGNETLKKAFVLTDRKPLVDMYVEHNRNARNEKEADLKTREYDKFLLAAATHVHDRVEANLSSSSVVVNTTGQTTQQSTSRALHVLSVGINTYPGKMKLDCAVPDARAMAETFTKYSRGLYQVDTHLLLDRNATRSAILKGLDDLAVKAKSDDLAVFYYAGHGDCNRTNQFQMIPVDADIQRLGETGISGDDLRARLTKLPCTVLLIMDCCNAGGFDKTVRKRSLPTESGAPDSEDRGLVVMCGARRVEEAGEEVKVGHGYFTKALIDGMSGKAASKRDGLVYLTGLQLYVEESVREMSHGEQFPTIGKPTLISSFPLTKP
jgi:hypothetical protein